jgi:hypothetical protein
MEKKIFVILTFILTINLTYAQTDCQKAKVQATLDFHKSKYSFHSEEMFPVEQTYFYVLSQYYKINWYFTDSLAYYKCYDSTMTELLQKKYGKDFLNRALVLTDSLDKTVNWKKDAEFPGGQEALSKYISTKLKQIGILKDDFKTKIYVEFEITPSGKVTNPEITRGTSTVIDLKVRTIINQMPKWSPAYMYGKPIKQRYTMPIKLE